MNETTGKLLGKATRSIAAAESSLADGHIEAAASRAYYAMFYVAEALPPPLPWSLRPRQPEGAQTMTLIGRAAFRAEAPP